MTDGDAETQMMRQAYDRRRKYLMRRFSDMDIPCFEPKGAFYIFPNIQEFGMTSEEFALELLQRKKVAVVPGQCLRLLRRRASFASPTLIPSTICAWLLTVLKNSSGNSGRKKHNHQKCSPCRMARRAFHSMKLQLKILF